MKPETKAKLDKIVPLLAHWMEGGNFLVGGREKPCLAAYIPVSDLILIPERYSIFKEPRVIYVNENNGTLLSFTCTDEPPAAGCARRIRFVEDLLNSLDADHHLPEPSEKAKAYQSTV